MEKTDLRVVKTRQAIRRSLLELLKEKPLEKISVAELSRMAQINKGTFYLHYQDMHDLYNQTLEQYFEELLKKADFFPLFFDAPSEFLLKCDEVLQAGIPELKVLHPGHDMRMIMPKMLKHFTDRVYETGRLERCPENDLRVDAALQYIMLITPRYKDKLPQEMSRVFCDLIQALFQPEASHGQQS